MQKKRAILDEEIKIMKDMDIIEESNSPFNSPLILVQKADSTFRIVTDFRKINQFMETEVCPLPTFEESLEILGKNKFFTSLDLAQAYLQVPLHKDSRMYTGCTAGRFHFVYKRLPYGLKNNTAIFQSMMNLLLGDMQYKRAMIYVDDCLVFSHTFNEHMSHLKELFSKLNSANLKLKLNKCSFFKKQVTYLGHIITEQGIIPSEKKVQAVLEYPVPHNAKTVRSWLGLTNYFRRFIPDYASLAAPLNELTKPTSKFKWGNVEQEAFQTLKSLLVSPPILAHPDVNKPYIVTADASSFGIGAILSQMNENDEEHVICYFSKKLTPTQRNYCATDLELLACITAMEQFRPYLYGRKFKLITDHRPILYLQNMKNLNARHFRYILKLQEFRFEIIHRQGLLHGNVDMLSRNPQFLDSISKFKNTKVNLIKKILVNSDQLKDWKKLVCNELGLDLKEEGSEYSNEMKEFDPHSFYKAISRVISNDSSNYQVVRDAIHKLTSANKKFLEKGGHFGDDRISSHMQGIKNKEPASILDIKTAASLLKTPIILKNNQEDIIFGMLESPLKPFPPLGAIIVLERDNVNNWCWTNKDLSLPKNNNDFLECQSKNIKKASRQDRDPGDKIIAHTGKDPQVSDEMEDNADSLIHSIKVLPKSKEARIQAAQENLKTKLSDTTHIRLYAVRKQKDAKSDHLYIPTPKEIASCQERDIFCRKWIDYFKNNTQPMFTNYFFNKYKNRYRLNDEGVLVYSPITGCRRGERPPSLIVLPLNMFKFAMESLHVYMSHIGIKKTMQLASNHYHRPGLKRLISKYITACALCQNKRGTKKHQKAEIQPIPPASDRFQIFSIDACGPFKLTQRRNKFIISVIDHFSRWVELIPVNNIKSDTVAEKILIHLIARFGVPQRLHSDNGSNFSSTLIQSICKVLKIKKTFSSALHPESNAVLERFHLFMGNALRTTILENQSDWDLRIPHLLLAYRTTTHSAINECPCYVVYGSDLVLPTQLLPTRDTNPDNLNPHEKGAEVAIKFAEARELYRKIMEKQNELSRNHANKNRTIRDLKIGDIVLMRRPLTQQKLSSKLHRPYVGEYRIIEKNGKVNFVVQEKNGRRTFKTHIDRLIKTDPSFIEQTSHWADEAADIFKEDQIEEEMNISELYIDENDNNKDDYINDKDDDDDDDNDEDDWALIPCSIDQFISRNYE